ncbi:MAG: T9SS type A sorting domain-containing protein [Saprospiraceae bacterium]|nr:T9SS type A sorting domain-containing protein [Saprospiraceae bacterium]
MKSLLFGILFISPLYLFSQRGTTAAGGEIKSSAGEISYSIGQLQNGTLNTASGSIYEGLQQPYEIVVTQTTNWGDRLGIQITAYPNPVSDQLHLTFDQDPPDNCLVRCTNAFGVHVFSREINQLQTALRMHELTPGYYFLTVFASGTLLSSFTIIKQ